MHIHHAVLVGCLAAGCAAAGTRTGDTGSGDTALRQRADHIGNGIDVATVTATRTKLAFDADIVFGVLPLVYDAIPIPVTTIVGADRTIGNMRLALRRSLGSMPLSRYVDCGGLAGVPNADSYDVTLSIVTEVRKDGTNASIVSTLVEAIARPATSRGDAFRCVTLGALELRIADLARAKAAQVPR